LLLFFFIIIPLPLSSTLFPYTTLFRSKFRLFASVYKYLIKEALVPLGYNCERADEIPESGAIPEQIRKALRDADLVVADLTDRKDRKSTRLNSSHVAISYAVFCLKKKI